MRPQACRCSRKNHLLSIFSDFSGEGIAGFSDFPGEITLGFFFSGLENESYKEGDNYQDSDLNPEQPNRGGLARSADTPGASLFNLSVRFRGCFQSLIFFQFITLRIRSNINYYINLKLLSLKSKENLDLLELYNSIRLKRYIFIYSYLIRLNLKKLEKKRKIAYLSLSIKRSFNLLRNSIILKL